MRKMKHLVLWLLAAHAPVQHVHALKYIVMTSPEQQKVYYHRIGTFRDEALTKADGLTRPPSSGAVTAAPPVEEPPLLIGKNLQYPIGLAYDTDRSLLYVTDPMGGGTDGQAGAGCIYKYVITVGGDTLTAGPQNIAVMSSPARWVTVDSSGKLYFTNENLGFIQTAPAGAEKYTPTTLYSKEQFTMVSAPAGIATDGHFIFWANKVEGNTNGAVVKAIANKPTIQNPTMVGKLLGDSPQPNKAYGVALTHSNVFFSDESGGINAAKQNGGGALAVVTSRLQAPRGLAWDGDGTVYAADKTGNAIYSFAANMPKVRALKQLKKVCDITGPVGLVVLADSAPGRPGLLGIMLLVLATSARTYGLS